MKLTAWACSKVRTPVGAKGESQSHRAYKPCWTLALHHELAKFKYRLKGMKAVGRECKISFASKDSEWQATCNYLHLAAPPLSFSHFLGHTTPFRLGYGFPVVRDHSEKDLHISTKLESCCLIIRRPLGLD